MNDADTLQNYIEVLEKTNQQLSLWYNPAILSIAILTALVTFLAIAVAYVIWKQQQHSRAFFDEQREIIDEKTKVLAQSSLDAYLKERSKELESLRGEARKKIEVEVRALRSAMQLFDPYTNVKPRSLSVLAHDLRAQDRERRGDPNLTQDQISAIIDLLESFGAKETTIGDVRRSLGGRRTRTLS